MSFGKVTSGKIFSTCAPHLLAANNSHQLQIVYRYCSNTALLKKSTMNKELLLCSSQTTFIEKFSLLMPVAGSEPSILWLLVNSPITMLPGWEPVSLLQSSFFNLKIMLIKMFYNISTIIVKIISILRGFSWDSNM